MTEKIGASDVIDKVEALVVGGGPAGLMAAEVLGGRGARVVVAEAMPSVGRKFLMAGKSGLNLTHAGERFAARYSDGSEAFDRAVEAFGPDAVRTWAEGLGEPLFTGSSGRVFPVAMKASPLLRKWLTRLGNCGVEVRTRWRWAGWKDGAFVFETPEGARHVEAEVAIMALGGGSWARLGSNGRWMESLRGAGVACADFAPSNAGLRIDWSPHMHAHFGAPVKAVALRAGDVLSRGEWIVTPRGIEGGGVYEVTRAVRQGARLMLDVAPEFGEAEVVARLARVGSKASMSNRLRKALGLSPMVRALVMEWGRPLPEGAALAARLKAMPVPVAGIVPLDEAISTAGGVDWAALDGFELKARPGVFAAGEMLAWDAPTGGWLLTGCLATGRAAGLAAAARLRRGVSR